jgi:hypothetical protein
MRITHEQYEYFKERVAFWIKELQCGHLSWSTTLKTEAQEDSGQTSLACTNFNVVSRWAKIYLFEDWEDYPINLETLNSTAFHEVCEAGLLADVRIHAEDREFNQEQFDIEIHRVVRILEKVLAKEGIV